jgi:transcriptional regulator with XRE-family HTH domain
MEMPTTIQMGFMGAKRKPSTADSVFAQRLKALRIAQGFETIRELARALDVLENTYSRYERAECKPDLFLLPKLFRVLRIDANEFFERVLPTEKKRRH